MQNETTIVAPVSGAYKEAASAKPMLLPGQVKEDHPKSGVVLTACGYRDRNRVPEFMPKRG